MKRIYVIIVFMNLLLSASAQLVINSQFQPITYDEMVAPLIMVQRFQKECLNNLQEILNQTETVEVYISKEKDPIVWGKYADCYNSIISAYNSIIENGTNQGTRGVISNKRKESISLVNMIKSAYEKRNRMSQGQYARLQAVPGLVCNKYYSDISLDAYINGKEPEVTYKTKEDLNK